MNYERFFVIAFATVCLATFVGGAMQQSGSVRIDAVENPTYVWTGATVCFDIYPTNALGANQQFIFAVNKGLTSNYWYIRDGNLYFENFCLWFSCDEGEWHIPIDGNVWQSVCMTYDYNSDETSDPVFVVGKYGGTSIPTVTEDSIPAGLLAMYTPDKNYWVGTFLNGTYPFQGQISEVAIYGKKLGNGNMQNITGSMMKGKHLQYANSDYNLLNYWMLDDIRSEINSTNTTSRAAYGGTNLTVLAAIGKAETGYSYQ